MQEGATETQTLTCTPGTHNDVENWDDNTPAVTYQWAFTDDDGTSTLEASSSTYNIGGNQAAQADMGDYQCAVSVSTFRREKLI